MTWQAKWLGASSIPCYHLEDVILLFYSINHSTKSNISELSLPDFVPFSEKKLYMLYRMYMGGYITWLNISLHRILPANPNERSVRVSTVSAVGKFVL